jgi:hypothetical protein
METSQGLNGWISEKECQALLGCRTTKLWALRKKGMLTSSKIGNKTWYKLSSITELLEKNVVNL